MGITHMCVYTDAGFAGISCMPVEEIEEFI